MPSKLNGTVYQSITRPSRSKLVPRTLSLFAFMLVDLFSTTQDLHHAQLEALVTGCGTMKVNDHSYSSMTEVMLGRQNALKSSFDECAYSYILSSICHQRLKQNRSITHLGEMLKICENIRGVLYRCLIHLVPVFVQEDQRGASPKGL